MIQRFAPVYETGSRAHFRGPETDPANEKHEGGHEQRPYDEGIEEDAQSYGEPDLEEILEGNEGKQREGSGESESRGVDGGTGALQGEGHGFGEGSLFSLFPDGSHDKDIVVAA